MTESELSFPQAGELHQGTSGVRHRESHDNCISNIKAMTKKYITYTITCQPFNPEIISGILWELKIAGLVEEENHIKIFAFQDSAVSGKSVRNILEKMKMEKLIGSFTVSKEILEDRNWNEEWEKSREVIRISDRIIVKPSFREYTPGKNEIVIIIDPKMSFGTGEHQSTKLVLRLMEKYVEPGMKVLDIGSGTGILAIAAVKLGAAKAVAVDYDETCYKNCRENCKLNNLTDRTDIITGEIEDVKENNFDLILANIQKNVLIEIAGKIKLKTRGEGIVILSGLLIEDEEAIVNSYFLHGFKQIDKLKMDAWISLVFKPG